MKGNIHLSRKDIRFAVDAGNGAGGPTALAAMAAVGLSPVALLCEMDGRFPVHHPDPSQPKNLELLVQTIREQKLDFGIAYDGDADRIGVVDARGEVIWGDKFTIILARAILKEHPGAAVIGEVKCSQTMYDDITAHGGRAIMWKTGHSLIKTKMKEEGALLAGEMSGHVFIGDRYFGFDDAVYASLRMIEIFAAQTKPLHELIADVPETFSTPELRVDCADDLKFAVVDASKRTTARPTTWWTWTARAFSLVAVGGSYAPRIPSPSLCCDLKRTPRPALTRFAPKWRPSSPARGDNRCRE
jgi:phosphomannomutase/phosphoglucomutase